MTRLSLPIVLALFAVACGGQTFDVSGPDDASTDAPGADTHPGGDAPSTDAPSTDAPSVDGSPGLPPDWIACGDPTDCVVTPASCCGSCGAATTGDAIAVNKAFLGQYRFAACSPGSACPDCAGHNDPNLQATCVGGQCRVIDVALSDLSSCSSDGDCVLRATECCEPCGTISAFDLIALNRSQVTTYTSDVCAKGGVGCPACAPIYPTAFSAKCDPTTSHCVVFGAK